MGQNQSLNEGRIQPDDDLGLEGAREMTPNELRDLAEAMGIVDTVAVVMSHSVAMKYNDFIIAQIQSDQEREDWLAAVEETEGWYFDGSG